MVTIKKIFFPLYFLISAAQLHEKRMREFVRVAGIKKYVYLPCAFEP